MPANQSEREHEAAFTGTGRPPRDAPEELFESALRVTEPEPEPEPEPDNDIMKGQPNAVSRITLSVELLSGDVHTVVLANPGPTGANPRFMTRQLVGGTLSLVRRVRFILNRYADQL